MCLLHFNGDNMVEFKYIEGGSVTSPLGFTADGVCAGVKPSNTTKRDLALICCEKKCNAAAIFTKNLVKSDTIYVTQKHLENGTAQAVVVNSGNANACNPDGYEKAEQMCRLTAEALGIDENDIIVASTGVIGQPLPIEPIEKGIASLKSTLSKSGGTNAAEAIMTTDTVKKEYAFQTEIGGKTVHLGGISKGSGMIHPNMGTMLCFMTTDCAIAPALLDKALREAVRVSFHRISVDGDTSTNDTCAILANAMAGNPEITAEGADYDAFLQMLTTLCIRLARDMAADGEGAQHLITCQVQNALHETQAEIIGKSVIASALTKAAIFGCDANWGRVLCAMGYSGQAFDPAQVDVAFSSQVGRILVCSHGKGLDFDEALAKQILSEKEVVIEIDLRAGSAEATCWGCDLTYDYVRINGDYRT